MRLNTSMMDFFQARYSLLSSLKIQTHRKVNYCQQYADFYKRGHNKYFQKELSLLYKLTFLTL